MVQAYRILARKPFNQINFSADVAFQLSASESFPVRVVLDSAGWTLFSFDFKRSEAIFLDIGPHCDLSAAPFSSQMQYDSAQRLLRLPFEDFISLAAQIKMPARMVHLFNIGHCGSTLLHHAFNRAGRTWCISEPLFTFDAAMWRGPSDDIAMEELLRAGMQFLRLFPVAIDADVVVIKHYSQATLQIPIYADATLAAKRLFLYREGNGWCNSVYHFSRRMGTALDLGREERNFVWWIMSGAKPQNLLDGVVDMAADRVGFDELAAAAWVVQLRDDVLSACAGLPMLPLRYDELTTHPAAIIGQVFDHCGITGAHVQHALLAFDKDSHAGTATSRDIPALDLGPVSLGKMQRIFANPKMAFPADTLLPGTLTP